MIARVWLMAEALLGSDRTRWKETGSCWGELDRLMKSSCFLHLWHNCLWGDEWTVVLLRLAYC